MSSRDTSGSDSTSTAPLEICQATELDADIRQSSPTTCQQRAMMLLSCILLLLAAAATFATREPLLYTSTVVAISGHGLDRPDRLHTCRAGNQTLEMPERVPGFIIIGTQKGGTTALFQLLKMQPDAMGSNVIETHFFDSGMLQISPGNKSLSELTDEDVCLLRHHYVNNYFHIQHYLNMTRSGKRLVAFEKTPAYLRMPGVAARIHRILGPDLKLIVVLRNPIDRALSAYRMIEEHAGLQYCVDTPKENLTFHDVIANELEQLRQLGLTRAPLLGTYSAQKHEQYHHLFVPPAMTQQLRNRMDEAIRLDSVAWSTRLCGLHWNSLFTGMYAMQLKEWIQYFPLGTHLKVIRSEVFMAKRKEVYGDMLDFVGLSPDQIDENALQQDLSPQSIWLNSSRKETTPAKTSTLQYLRDFFKPYNDELADLLGDEWRGVWDR